MASDRPVNPQAEVHCKKTDTNMKGHAGLDFCTEECLVAVSVGNNAFLWFQARLMLGLVESLGSMSSYPSTVGRYASASCQK
jgi:hypothetical protein